MSLDPSTSPATQDDIAMERLQHELAHPPFHSVLRPQAIDARLDGRVEILLPYQPVFGRAEGSGNVHGGVIAALIDLSAHAAVAVQTGRMAPTVDLRIDYLRAAPAADLIARARTLQVGRNLARADVDITAASGGPVIAVGRGTFSTFVPPSPVSDPSKE
jgi:uncharacterized protein (TIGR00369 family)